MKMKIITERKIVEVVPGYFIGSPRRIEVDVCVDCGAMVFDPVRHGLWHTASAVLGKETS